MKNLSKTLSNLPSFVWIFIIPLALIIFVGSIISLFVAIATIEGFASIIFIILGLLYIRGSTTDIVMNSKLKEKSSGFFLALGLCFFALMGVAIDQPGNYFYNKPLEIFFCPEDTKLNRDEIISNPLPGRTDITQNFVCFDTDGNEAKTNGIGEVLLVRFVEYIILGYIIIGISKYLVQRKLKQKQSGAVSRN